MTSSRVIVCLDVDQGRVKKGVRFQTLVDMGDPVELAARYEKEGADEIVFLDVTASVESRALTLDMVRRTANVLFIPLTVGGGIRTLDDVNAALRAGADKVGINSAALTRPELLTETACAVGSQCVVISIDALRNERGWSVVTHGGRRDTGRDVVAWAKEAVSRGAGEILLTSIDCDGARTGYDLELLQQVASAVTVPVIASGGAGRAEHLAQAFTHGADAALVAGILHDGSTTVTALKDHLRSAGLEVR